MKSIQHLCRVLLVADNKCHETDFLEAWHQNSDHLPINFELVFSLCPLPTTCCSSLHFWTMFGQDFLGRFFCLRRPQRGNDCGKAISLDKNLFALEQLLQDVPYSHLFHRQKSMMLTDAWKSQYGLPNSPNFVQREQPLCYSFTRKISEVTIKLPSFSLVDSRAETTSECQ